MAKPSSTSYQECGVNWTQNTALEPWRCLERFWSQWATCKLWGEVSLWACQTYARVYQCIWLSSNNISYVCLIYYLWKIFIKLIVCVCVCVWGSGSWSRGYAPIWAAAPQQRKLRWPRRTWTTLIRSWENRVTDCWTTRRSTSWRTTWQWSTTSWAQRWGNCPWVAQAQLQYVY